MNPFPKSPTFHVKPNGLWSNLVKISCKEGQTTARLGHKGTAALLQTAHTDLYMSKEQVYRFFKSLDTLSSLSQSDACKYYTVLDSGSVNSRY